MKKRFFASITSAVMTICLAAASIAPLTSTASTEKKNMVVLGDSISTGYSEAGYAKENYGDLVSDYYDYDLTNLAVNGLTTTGLIDKISSETSTQEYIAQADVIVISIGGNDLIGAAKSVAEAKYPGKTLDEALEMLKTATLDEASSFSSAVDAALGAQVTASTPYLTQLNTQIRELNADAEIVFQTVYNPLVISESLFKTLSLIYNTTYVQAYQTFRNMLRINIIKFNRVISALDNVKIADVYDAFSEDADDKFGYANCFTDIMSKEQRDFHPNELGHLAIAAEVIEVLGAEEMNSTAILKRYNSITATEKLTFPIETMVKIESATGVLNGDYNNDRVIDAVDASLVLSYYAAVQSGATAEKMTTMRYNAIDTDNNGVVDAVDASNVLTHYSLVQTGGEGIL